MSREGVNAVKAALAKEHSDFFHDLAFAAEKAMKEDVMKAMKVFYGL